jgi:hypothetical protein
MVADGSDDVLGWFARGVVDEGAPLASAVAWARGSRVRCNG